MIQFPLNFDCGSAVYFFLNFFQLRESSEFPFRMKVTGAGGALLVAAMAISVIAGFSICAIDLHLYDAKKELRYGYRNVWKSVLDLALPCGIFGAARAILSLSAIVILCLSGCVSPVAVVLVAAVSAGLYFGELIPGSMLISETYLGVNEPWRSNADRIYHDDPEFVEWSETFKQRQSKYTGRDNNWWHWGEDLPLGLAPDSYKISSWYNWTGNNVERITSENPIESCIINYNVSKGLGQFENGNTSPVNKGPVVYDCGNIDLVVVDCLSGWDEASLNSQVKRRCRNINEYAFEQYRPVETPTPVEDALGYETDVMMLAMEDAVGIYYLNSILIALETASFVLALAGILVVALSGLCSGKSAKSTHSSSKDKSSSLSDVAAKEEVVVWSADPPPPQPEPQYRPPPQAEPQNEPAEQPLEDQHDSSSSSDSSSASSTSS